MLALADRAVIIIIRSHFWLLARTMMRLPLASLLTLGIVVTCIQTIYSSISLSRWGNMDQAPRQLKMFVEKPSRNNWTEPENFQLLPKRLLTVFGLESSGTTLIAETLAKAVGADVIELFQGLMYRTNKHGERIAIQHISQPWGFFHDEGLDNQTVVAIEVLPPYECAVWPHYFPHDIQETCNKAKPHPKCLQETGLRKRVILPQRFMVNITSHIQWYLERNVEATAVIVVRDDYAHLHGKLRIHNDEMNHAMVEDERAKEFIVEAMQKLESLPKNGHAPQIILLSYETLMSLREPYLFDLYKRLGINSTLSPVLENGNKKYIVPPNGTSNETWWNTHPVNVTMTRPQVKNML